MALMKSETCAWAGRYSTVAVLVARFTCARSTPGVLPSLRSMERAQAAQVPVTATLGRHTNDRMVSFYVRTPAGFEVEFGFGAIAPNLRPGRA